MVLVVFVVVLQDRRLLVVIPQVMVAMAVRVVRAEQVVRVAQVMTINKQELT